MSINKIYFNEYNLLMGSGGIVYLPIVSGILSALLKNSSLIKGMIDIQEFIFKPDSASSIINKYTEPSIAAFSISMWNEKLSLEVAKKIKERYPNCFIIFGGAQCPHNAVEYMNENIFIDACIRAEGEEAFVKLVEARILGTSYEKIPNLCYRINLNEIVTNAETADYDRSLDIYPSPYLSGEFDYLLNQNDHGLQAIIETNRGCPFLCTFCYWGKGGSATKYRFKSLEIVFKEIEYLANKKVEYIFNADSNFGMHQRDYDIALKLIECKKKTGYPEKFRTCWGKNTSERIFKIASLLQYHELDKGVTLARQSNSKIVLQNIKRENIKLDTYTELERNFNKLNVPIYCEIILGLPGETIDSWISGIDEILDAGINNQLFIYQAEVYPNTELGNIDYQNKFKIMTHQIKLNEIHCSPRPSGWISEFQNIVIESYSMTIEDWKFMTKYSIVTMLMHSMKLGFYILDYLKTIKKIKPSVLFNLFINSNLAFLKSLNSKIDSYIENLLKGDGRGLIHEKYSDVYLDIEEYLFIHVIDRNIDLFYDEINILFLKFIEKDELIYWCDLLKFQSLSLPFFSKTDSAINVSFKTNIPEFLLRNINNNTPDKLMIKIPDENNNIDITFTNNHYNSFHDFVKKQIIWSRKSNNILLKSNLELDLKEINKKSYDINNYTDEKTFSISLFDKENRNKFSKYKEFIIQKES